MTTGTPLEDNSSVDSPRLLLVDDDASILTLLSEFVEGMGYPYSTASDGVEAMEAMERQPATVVITDLLMPRMDGMDLLKRIKSRWPDTDVIVITGHTREFRYTDVVREGASDFLQKPFSLDEFEAKLLRVLREHALRTMLRRLAVRDPLTDLYNRRFFEERIEEEAERAGRQGYPLFLILVDIDQFKEVNDTHGHHEGDRILKVLADVLIKSTRRHVDTPFRFGGDEFAVLVPQATERQACQIAERIRQNYEAGDVRGTTLSLGVAGFVRTQAPIRQDIDILIRNADDSLYAAKRAGGNCVLVNGRTG
ncbi:MAG: diguanylate cyclase [Deltaproteobacteria bacterium]